MGRSFKSSLKDLEFIRKATSIYDLSDDNLAEIFFRLPVRGVLCCQCVCKRFSKVITEPKFKGIHVKRAITSNTTSFCSVFLHGVDVASNNILKWRYDHILLENTHSSASFSYLKLSNPLSCKLYIVGSCNGLLCARLKDFRLSDQNESYMLIWNPVTRENRFVAEPKINASSKKVDHLALAFGFTTGTNDYKVVRIISYPEAVGDLNLKLEVFNMSTDKWSTYQIKTLQCREIDHMPPQVDPSVLVGIFSSSNTRSIRGAFHWLSTAPLGASRDYTAILSFDLEEEQLRLFTVLDSNKIPHVRFGMLDCINDSLSVIVPYHQSPSTNIDIWVMNDYGDRNSWIKMYTVDHFQGVAVEPIGYWKDDLFLVAEKRWEDRCLCLYNLRNQEMKFFQVPWPFLKSAKFCDYVETFETVSQTIATTGDAV